MRVLYILCGGKGKRLGAITRRTPKPLIRINGKQFISYLIDLYSPNFDRIVLLAGYMGEEFLKLKGKKVDVIIEDSPLGTGGGLLRIKDELPEQFFVCNGDTFIYPFELEKNIQSLEKEDKTALLLCEEEKKARGHVELDGNQIVAFREKEGTGKGYVNAGFLFMKKRDLKGLNPGEMSLEKELYPILAGKGRLCGHVGNCKIYDIGTPAGIKKFKELQKAL